MVTGRISSSVKNICNAVGVAKGVAVGANDTWKREKVASALGKRIDVCRLHDMKKRDKADAELCALVAQAAEAGKAPMYVCSECMTLEERRAAENTVRHPERNHTVACGGCYLCVRGARGRTTTRNDLTARRQRLEKPVQGTDLGVNVGIVELSVEEVYVFTYTKKNTSGYWCTRGRTK